MGSNKGHFSLIESVDENTKVDWDHCPDPLLGPVKI